MVVKKVKESKTILIVVMLVLVVLLIAIGGLKEQKSFEIEDKCGRFMNLMSHTIEDESTCESRCKSQCEAVDYRFSNVDFEVRDLGCNYCMCYCK